jgi:AcrR family transcriptional regulator
MKTAERRQNLKDTLIALAERIIDQQGLAAVRARDLATQAGCAVGAIYNVFADLDDLILAVNQRTLTEIEAELARSAGLAKNRDVEDVPQATGHLVRLALSYLHFAAARTQRWRALFEHRLPEGKDLPDWYAARRQRLFAFVEQPLRVLRPDLPSEQAALLARSLFSAVHGIVVLGLEEKIGDISVPELEEQITTVVTALGRGLSTHKDDGSRKGRKGSPRPGA